MTGGLPAPLASLTGWPARRWLATAASAAVFAIAAGGGLLSALAIGCPVCNKAVVLLLGSAGALTVWAPPAADPRSRLARAARVGAAHPPRRRARLPADLTGRGLTKP